MTQVHRILLALGGLVAAAGACRHELAPTGTLAPGLYRHVRLFVTDPTIYLRNRVVTPAGDALKAGVGIPVIIPSADSTGAAIKTDERFTVPTGGGTVQLYFDADDTIRHIVVTGAGTIIVPPVIR